MPFQHPITTVTPEQGEAQRKARRRERVVRVWVPVAGLVIAAAGLVVAILE